MELNNPANLAAAGVVKDMLAAKAIWEEVNGSMTWSKPRKGTVMGEEGVRKAIKNAQQQFKCHYDKRRRTHHIKKGDWVHINKKGFPQGYFHDDRKATLNSKFSFPARVIAIRKGSAMLQANHDFCKDT
jgi:hypothetical protein